MYMYAYFENAAEVSQGLQMVGVDHYWSQGIIQCVAETLQQATAVIVKAFILFACTMYIHATAGTFVCVHCMYTTIMFMNMCPHTQNK